MYATKPEENGFFLLLLFLKDNEFDVKLGHYTMVVQC